MPTADLGYMLDRIASIRKDRPCRFLELPPELRNAIYRLTITPEMVESHIRQGKSPALLRTNRQISKEFRTLYYNPEYILIVLFHGDSEGWKPVIDPQMIQSIVARQQLNRIELMFGPEDIALVKSRAEQIYANLSRIASEMELGVNRILQGVVTVPGLGQFMCLPCSHYVGFIESWFKKYERDLSRESMRSGKSWIVE